MTVDEKMAAIRAEEARPRSVAQVTRDKLGCYTITLNPLNPLHDRDYLFKDGDYGTATITSVDADAGIVTVEPPWWSNSAETEPAGEPTVDDHIEEHVWMIRNGHAPCPDEWVDVDNEDGEPDMDVRPCACLLCRLPRGPSWGEYELERRIRSMGEEVGSSMYALAQFVSGAETDGDYKPPDCNERRRALVDWFTERMPDK